MTFVLVTYLAQCHSDGETVRLIDINVMKTSETCINITVTSVIKDILIFETENADLKNIKYEFVLMENSLKRRNKNP